MITNLPFEYNEGTLNLDTFLMEGEINPWAKDIDNENVILSDYHSGVAQVLYLHKDKKEYYVDMRFAESVLINYDSKYGIATKVWYKVKY